MDKASNVRAENVNTDQDDSRLESAACGTCRRDLRQVSEFESICKPVGLKYEDISKSQAGDDSEAANQKDVNRRWAHDAFFGSDNIWDESGGTHYQSESAEE